ncbi:MAG: PAS domain S-box protein [Gammaproteobacteria bacterium]|nr:PAS domain S-box protein [Gammaproteobacteria bacterium]
MDTAVDSIVVADEEGIIRYYNGAAERLFGFTAKEAVGNTLGILMREPERRHHGEYISRYLATGEKHIVGTGRPVEAQHKDGTPLTVYLAVSEFETASGPCFAGVMHDLSPELEARELRGRLERTGRLSAMAETAAAIVHEVSQPLAAIAIFAQTARDLADGNVPDERMVAALDKVIEQALHAGLVMERVQSLIRGDEGQYETANINALAADVVEIARLDARGHNIGVELSLEDDLPGVECDAVQIQQVVLNLLRNAIEAMSEPDRRRGDTITVKTRAEDPGHVRIDVIDRGPGLVDDIEGDLFTTSHAVSKRGLGVGLAICRTVVLNHNGRLDYANNANAGGAIFSVTLPLIHESGLE